MKYRNQLWLSAISLSLFCFIAFISCKKEASQNTAQNQEEQEASLASGEADGEAEMIYNGVFDDAMGVNDQVALGGTGVFGRQMACPTVTITPLTSSPFPVRVVLDYGTTGCTGNDGHLRRGKIITVYTDRLVNPGAVATTVFDGFYVDSIKVEGRHIITNTSTANTNRRFTVDVNDGKLTRPSGNFVQWNSHKVITQFEGLATAAPMDDIFRIEGTASGKVRRGSLLVVWESAITEPLIKRFACRWIVRGRIRTIRANLATNSPWIGILDFGAGSCDNQATVIINGISHQITLP